jgi:hypothetical protein
MSRLRRLAGALVLMLIGSAGPGIPHGTPGPAAQGPPPAPARARGRRARHHAGDDDLDEHDLDVDHEPATSARHRRQPRSSTLDAAGDQAELGRPPAGARAGHLLRAAPVPPAGQHTATGKPVGPGSLAVDRRLIPLGSTVELAGLGTFTANDTGGAIRGPHVDLWRSSCAGWANPTVLATIL